MTSSIHSLTDNSDADEQRTNLADDQPSSPSDGMSHPATASAAMHYAGPGQPGGGNQMAHAGFPYPDPYYRTMFSPYNSQPYTAQPYPAHPMLMGLQQAVVPLPSEAVEEPVFVNAKQYHGILRRRQSRAKAESENKLAKSRKPYLHESRHLHALRRARGTGGRFQKKNEKQKKEAESSERARGNINLNCEKGSAKVTNENVS